MGVDQLVGKKIRLVSMSNDPDPIPPGTMGKVRRAEQHDFGGGDRWTQISVDWENGRSLTLCSPPDQYEVVDA